MKTQTSKLIGLPLDWAVSTLLTPNKVSNNPHKITRYSSDFKISGPILENLLLDGLKIEAVDKEHRAQFPAFKATLNNWETVIRGDTILITALRCLVVQHYGETIEIPQFDFN
jgi:hypothetical protein